MPRVKILYFAQLREAAGCGEETVELKQPMAVGVFVKDILNQPKFKASLDLRFRYAINDEFVDEETLIEKDATVAIIPPVAGG